MMTRDQHSQLLDMITERTADPAKRAELLEIAEEYYEAANDAEDNLVGELTTEQRFSDFMVYVTYSR